MLLRNSESIQSNRFNIDFYHYHLHSKRPKQVLAQKPNEQHNISKGNLCSFGVCSRTHFGHLEYKYNKAKTLSQLVMMINASWAQIRNVHMQATIYLVCDKILNVRK